MAPTGTVLPRQIDRYEIEGILGQGGFGTVFRARHTLTKQAVALKVLRGAALAAGWSAKDLMREAQILATIRHPNIVHVQDAGIAEGSAFFAMELVEGTSLHDWLATRGPIPIGLLMPIALQLCAGLAAAHAVGAVHRDIKPQNLVVLADGTLKILDFGISRSAFVSQSAPSQQTLAGTPGYLAPELLQSGHGDHRADIYGAGATLYELATGALPFPEKTFAELVARVTREPAPSLASRDPRLPLPFTTTIDRALAIDPDARFPSADAMRASFLGQLDTASPTITIGGQTPLAGNIPSPSDPPFGASLSPSHAPPAQPAYFTPPPPPLQQHTFLAPTQLAPPTTVVANKGSPLAWALGGGVAVLVLMLVGIGVGAGLMYSRSGGKPAADTFDNGVVIGPVKPSSRKGGRITTKTTCNGTQTLEFTNVVFDVPIGPALVTDDACDLHLIDCEIHGQIGIQGTNGKIVMSGGSITATKVAVDLDTADIEATGTTLSGPEGIVSDNGRIHLTKTKIVGTVTGIDDKNGNVTLADTDVTAPTAISIDGAGTDHFHGGHIKGTTNALHVEGPRDITVEGTKIEGPIHKGTLVKIKGM